LQNESADLRSAIELVHARRCWA